MCILSCIVSYHVGISTIIFQMWETAHENNGPHQFCTHKKEDAQGKFNYRHVRCCNELLETN